MSIELQISGMTCDACARHVSDALQHAGARSVEVDWRDGRAIVDPDGTSGRDLARALDETKYRVQRIIEADADDEIDACDFEFDLAIVGSGGGAFAAAIAARRRDLRVVMVERGVVGGTCVNIGCIPSKTLLAAAEARQRAAHGRFGGIVTEAGPVDVASLVAEKDDIVNDLRQAKYIDIAAEYGVELIAGNAQLSRGPHSTSTGAGSTPRTTWSRPAPSRTYRTYRGWPAAAI